MFRVVHVWQQRPACIVCTFVFERGLLTGASFAFECGLFSGASGKENINTDSLRLLRVGKACRSQAPSHYPGGESKYMLMGISLLPFGLKPDQLILSRFA